MNKSKQQNKQRKQIIHVYNKYKYILPNHAVCTFSNVREVAVTRPDIESLTADHLGTGSGVRAAASRGRYRSCRHCWETGLPLHAQQTRFSYPKQIIKIRKKLLCWINTTGGRISDVFKRNRASEREGKDGRNVVDWHIYSDSNLRVACSRVRLTAGTAVESENVAAGSNGADHVSRERRVVTIEIEVTR